MRQHAARQTWRTVKDFAESLAAEHQVADDDRGPALSEDLSTERDGAVLTIATHESILTSPAPAVPVQISNFTPALSYAIVAVSR